MMSGRSSGGASDLEAVAALAGRQHGVVTRTDLAATGMSRHAIRRWTDRGYLRPIHKSVYSIGDDVLPVRGHWLAAVLSLEHAVLSHRSAAQIRGLAAARPPIEVTVPIGRAKRRDGVRVHQSRHLDPVEIEVIGGIPVTSLPRTLLDIAGLGRYDELEALTAEAHRKGLLRPEELVDYGERIRSRPGARRLRELIRTLDPDMLATRSGGERWLISAIREAGITAPEVNVRIGAYEVDLLWRSERVVVELDGYTYHRDFRAFERDRRRGAYLARAGYEVVRVTFRMLIDEPDAVLASIRAALERRASNA